MSCRKVSGSPGFNHELKPCLGPCPPRLPWLDLLPQSIRIATDSTRTKTFLGPCPPRLPWLDLLPQSIGSARIQPRTKPLSYSAHSVPSVARSPAAKHRDRTDYRAATRRRTAGLCS